MDFGFGREQYGRVDTPPGRLVVLLAEDNKADVFLIRQALVDHGVNPQLFVAADGDEAVLLMEKIDSSALPCPELIVLDLNLPKRDGFDVLRRVKLSEKCGRVPVVMLSSSYTQKEREEAARLGAVSFLKKPSDLGEFLKMGEQIKRALPAGNSQ
jgi:chemotaxis family two-component system response regulator Rcp1